MKKRLESEAKIQKVSAIKLAAEENFSMGKNQYQLVTKLEDDNAPQERVDLAWRSTANRFCEALVMGHPGAPLALFKMFSQQLGVQENKYIEALMFGVAKELHDPKIQELDSDDICPIPQVPDSMKPAIAQVVRFMQEIQSRVILVDANIEYDDLLKVTSRIESAQYIKFELEIKLPNGFPIFCYLNKPHKWKGYMDLLKVSHPEWNYPPDYYKLPGVVHSEAAAGYPHHIDDQGAGLVGGDSSLADAFLAASIND